MSIMTNEYRDRLRHWERTLREDLYLPMGKIEWEGFTTMDYLTPAEAANSEKFKPVPAGTVWGHTWEYMWLRGRVTVPVEADGKIVVFDPGLNNEATIFVNGQAFGTYRTRGIEPRHRYIEDNALTWQAKAGENYDLLLEVYAGHYFPEDAGPVLPGTHVDPLTEGERATLTQATFGIWNEDAYQLWMDVETLRILLTQVPEESLRASKIADALERFTNIVDFEQDTEERMADYRKARKALAPALKAKNGDTVPRFSAIGNSHLDLAWLWPMAETYRKTARTFAAQLRLLDRYRDYMYIQSQPASYEMCREHYPELFERILAAVGEGRWLAEGAMYVEPDTNMPSGEALARQLIYGKRYYHDVFGVDSRMLWLPDTFGYSAVLPQLLKQSGVDYLVTQKIFWSYNGGERFPYHYFTWKGMDGTAVVSFLPTSYTYRTDPEEICQTWNNRVQQRNMDEFLLPFGYGDGGGGPCRDYIEHLEREKNLEGMPRVEMASPLKLFDDLQAEGGPKETWQGELYFTAHRATLTVQAETKKNNRRSEIALHNLEAFGALAMLLTGTPYDREAGERLWKEVLLYQFHDILPGSGIARIYEETALRQRAIQAEAAERTAGSIARLVKEGKGLTVMNSLGFARTALIDWPEDFGTAAARADGTAVPVVNGKARVTVPAYGWVTLAPGNGKADLPPAEAELTAEGAILRNRKVEVRLNLKGEVISFRNAAGREFAAGPLNEWRLYKDTPRVFDAWDLDSNYRDIPPVYAVMDSLEITEQGGMTTAVTRKGTIGNSTFSQVISLDAETETLVFDTTLDWHETHRLLKTFFPTGVLSENAMHEIQFGYVERPAHESRMFDKERFEVVNHRWTALADGSHGCAVLNDCKYGVSAREGEIGLSLMVAATSPALRTDQGEHHFRYAFTGWEGPFDAGRLTRQGLEFNVPVEMAKGCAGDYSFCAVDAGNVIVDTLKPADDDSGAVVLRLYECAKADTNCVLKLNLAAAQALACDLLENPIDDLDAGQEIPLHFRPFEVKTLKLKF